MADAVGCVAKAVDLALKIKDAVDTVRQNKKDCAHIKRRVERVRHTLSLCEGNAELMVSPAVRDAVEALAEVLGDALELVTGCQEETNALCLYCTAGKLSKQLGKVDRGITDGNCEATFAILVYHISKQNGDGAGPAMPKEDGEEEEGRSCSWRRQAAQEGPAEERKEAAESVPYEPKVQPVCGSAIPKFGDWDEDPSTGEGFTDIFQKVREEKQSSHTYTDRYNRGDKYESSVSGHGGGSPSEGEEDDYGGDGALLQEITRVTLAIRTAMETVRRNKDECVQIDKIASRVSLILSQLEQTEMMKDISVCRVLKSLLKTFRRAQELVVACQRRSVVVLCSPGNLSNDLRWLLHHMILGIDNLIDVLDTS